MTKSDFIQILKNPALMSHVQTFELEDVLQKFPFFQSARALFLKGLKSQNSFRYNKNLKITAAHTSERSILFQFITSDDFNKPILDKEETQIISNIQTIDESVNEKLNDPHTADNFISEKGIEALYDYHQISPPKESSLEIEKTTESETENIQTTTDETDEKEILENNTERNDSIEKVDVLNFDLPENSIESKEEEIIKNQEPQEEAPIVKNISDTELPNIEMKTEDLDVFLSYNETDKILPEVHNEEEQISEDEINEVNNLNDAQTFLLENKKSPADNLIDSELEENPDELEPVQDEILFELLPDEIFNSIEEVQLESIESQIFEQDTTISTPIAFKKDETLSFNDWLKLTTLQPIDREKSSDETLDLEKKLEIIDDFIVKNPKIEPIKPNDSSVKNEYEYTEYEEVMTETLARVYVLQNKFSDAIRAYEILSLKFPEKSSFFADQIKQIQILKKT